MRRRRRKKGGEGERGDAVVLCGDMVLLLWSKGV